jgi:hypothetical protein
MNNYFIVEKTEEKVPLIGATTYSTGDGLELTFRYAYDAGRQPQSLVRRKRNTALTATLNLNFTPSLCVKNGTNIMEFISKLEGIVGTKVTLYWQGKEKGSFVIKAAQFSTAVDVYSIYSEVSVGFSLIEGYVANPQPWNEVRA